VVRNLKVDQTDIGLLLGLQTIKEKNTANNILLMMKSNQNNYYYCRFSSQDTSQTFKYISIWLGKSVYIYKVSYYKIIK